MKVFILVSLAFAAVFAEPEAKADLVYTDGTFHTNLANLQQGVNTQYVKPVGAVYNSVPAPIAPYAAYAPATYAAYNPYVYSHLLGKREAEAEPKAEPKADAQFYGGAYSPYTAYAGAYSPYYSAATYSPYTYSPYSYGHYIGKREAEAEPKADAQFYGAYPYTTAYSGAYSPYYSAATYSPYTYSPYSYGHYIGKREAEAEPKADAQFYGAYPYTTAYSGAYSPYYSAATYSPYTYSPYSYSHYLGKREAEAEPKADAQFYGGAYSPYTTAYSGAYSPFYSASTYSPYTYGAYRPYSYFG